MRTLSSHPLSRQQWLSLLRAGLGAQAWNFVRQAADVYLQHVPHDLTVQLLRAEALLGLGQAEEAYRLAAAVALRDPEDRRAHDLCWRALPPEADEHQRARVAGALVALGAGASDMPTSAWGQAVYQAYHALQNGHPGAAQEILLPVLPGHNDIPLLAVAHLRLVWASGDWVATLHLARAYHRRWPHTLAIGLILAHHLAESGQETESVAMLHAIAVEDPAAQVAQRLFGSNFPYRALWAPVLAAPLDMPLPAKVAAALGKNRLPSNASPRHSTGTKAHPAAASPAASQPMSTTKSASATATTSGPAERVAKASNESVTSPLPQRAHAAARRRKRRRASRRLKATNLSATEGRFPVYVVLSTRHGLETLYGQETAQILIRQMGQLATAVEKPREWGALVLLADDAASAHRHGVKPVPPGDPWAIKKQLAALDAALKRKGSMIGALLIVGGEKVVPFHRLPNPIEDDDDVVPSDNPYGSLDENYFAPTWPVGRLPGSADGDPTLLLAALRRLTAEHHSRRPHRRWHRRWWQWLRAHLPFIGRNAFKSIGYTAAVWEKAARDVFRTIGSPKTMLSSPPLQAESLGVLPRAQAAYFNLHGLADAAAWYGQRLPTSADDTPDYPVALRPEDIPPQQRTPRVVFSEACYGAHIRDKTPQTAIALRFLYAGTHAFIGSTVTAYGTVTPPLSGADLLAYHFWQRLKTGVPAGEALRQAKYLYARQTHERFGFLDGEDQKTLISFVLYGDPLYRLENAPTLVGKRVLRPKGSLALNAAEEHTAADANSIPPRMSKQVQQLVKTYLPGNGGIGMLLAEERVGGQTKGKGQSSHRLARKIVVVSKHIPTGTLTHHHFMRVSIDKRGKVVKVTVSR